MLTTKQNVLRRFWYAVIALEDLKDGPEAVPAARRGHRRCSSTRTASPPALQGPLLPPHRQAVEGLDEGRPHRLRLPRLDLRPHRQARARPAVPGAAGGAEPLDAGLSLRRRATATPGSRSTSRWRRSSTAEEEHDPAYRRIPQFYEVWNTSALRLMENSFDNAHFAFVHKGTFGQLNQPLPEKYEIKETDYGFEAETLITVANPPVQYRISGTTEPTTKRHMRNKWYMPFCRKLDIEYPSGLRHIIFNSATPIDDDQHHGGAVALPQRHRGRLPGAGADRLGLQDHPRGQGHHRVDRPRRADRHEPPGRGAHGVRPARHDHAQAADEAARGARREPRCLRRATPATPPSPRSPPNQGPAWRKPPSLRRADADRGLSDRPVPRRHFRRSTSPPT